MSEKTQSKPARRRAPWLILGALLVVVAAVAGLLLFWPPRRPTVILISIDSLRPDHLGCYGYGRATSPEIDRLAAGGAVFEVVTSSSSWTLPAHAALFTGLPDRVHGCFDGDRWLPQNRRTLAEAFHDAGYDTVGFFSGPYLHPGFGFSQGFDTYHDCTSFSAVTIESLQKGKVVADLNQLSHRDVTNPIVLREVEKWLARDHDRPVFAFIHLWDVHYDYIPPAPYDRMFDPDYRGPVDGTGVLQLQHKPASWSPADLAHLQALYDGEIRWTDDTLKKILAAFRSRGLLEDAIVAVTADHGEAFYEHGLHGHRHSLYEEEIRIPLVIHHPRTVRGGTRIERPVEITDIGPTLLAMAGLEPLPRAWGKNLGPLLAEPDAPWAEVRAISELVVAAGDKHGFAIRTPGWKLIVDVRRAQTAVFDLVKDPGERTPLPHALLPLAPDMMRRLYPETSRALQRAATQFPTPQMRDTPAIGKMTEAQLRSLGYLK